LRFEHAVDDVQELAHASCDCALAGLSRGTWTLVDACKYEPQTIAEGAAWDLAGELGETTRLATVNPGAILGPVVCVIDRESGGREKLAVEGLELFPLYTMSELNSAGSGPAGA